MSHQSADDLLTLHAVRIKGFTEAAGVSARFGLDRERVETLLHEYVRAEWVVQSSFGDLSGWSLTEAGRARNQDLLSEELEEVGARDQVSQVHTDFLPYNATVTAACSAVQLDPRTDVLDRAWRELSDVAVQLRELEARLTSALARFNGYHSRFATALFRADDDPAWLTGTDVDSCHRVWFELHEDLIASLGLTR